MTLFTIEYDILSTGNHYVCRIVGKDREDVIGDIEKYVGGKIYVSSICHMGEVHRLTGAITQDIIDRAIGRIANKKGKSNSRTKTIYVDYDD